MLLPSEWHFDIDRYLNPILPSSLIPRLPYPVSHVLGHRTTTPPRPLGNIIVIFWAFIGVFCSITLIEVVGLHVPPFRERGAPSIVGSFVSVNIFIDLIV
jgi:hypothetical protein